SYDESSNSVNIYFASGTHQDVRLIVSNNGGMDSGAGPSSEIGPAALLDMGPTAFPIGRYPRRLVRGIQRSVYTTGRLVPLIAIGAAILLFAKHFRAVALLLLVPLYFVFLQSPLHTEYRYILPMQYTLFAVAGAAVWFLVSLLWLSVKELTPRIFTRVRARTG
ncbi:MAG: hypothetical protein ACREAC_08340, partial [Blastocatellia bacterium]